MTIECERCGRKTLDDLVETIVLADEYEICDGCIEDIEYRINNYYWYDRYTEEHHEKAVKELQKIDEIICVQDGHWESGEVIVHTNYVSSEVVSDFCDHFGFEIKHFGPRWEEEDAWDCVEEHGSCFEILLDYTSESPPPLPLDAELSLIDIDWLDENDKQFDAGY